MPNFYEEQDQDFYWLIALRASLAMLSVRKRALTSNYEKYTKNSFVLYM